MHSLKDGSPVAPTECPEDLKPLEEDDCDNNCTISEDGSGDNATEVIKTTEYLRRAKVYCWLMYW